jgi:hypothetical protein
MQPEPSMTLAQVADLGQSIWNDHMSLDQIVIALGVVYGDIARAARDWPPACEQDLRRELGNLILSTARWCRHLGFEPDDAVREAADAQRAWVANHK